MQKLKQIIKNPIFIVVTILIITASLYIMASQNKSIEMTEQKVEIAQKQGQGVAPKQEDKAQVEAKKKSLLEKIDALNKQIAVAKTQQELDELAKQKNVLLKEFSELDAKS